MCTAKENYLLPWAIILGLETLAIIIENTATVIVFWKRRCHLKRTCFILINLTVADLMVGVSNVQIVVAEILKLTSSICYLSWRRYVVLEELFGCASISFLVLISFERLHATVWPFRHRVTPKRKYIGSIVIGWLLSGVVAVIRLLEAFNLITNEAYFGFGAAYLIVCLLLMSSAYSVIWFFSKTQDPRLPINRQIQNKKLAKTLFIVTILSLTTWLPFVVVYVMRYCFHAPDFTGPIALTVARFFRLANSFINPIIYCFRIPDFRKTFKTLFCRQNVPGLKIRKSQQSCSEANFVVLISVSKLLCNEEHRAIT